MQDGTGRTCGTGRCHNQWLSGTMRTLRDPTPWRACRWPAAGAGSLRSLLQRDRPAVLVQEIDEGLPSHLLQRLHAVAGQQAQRVPSLVVVLHKLSSRPAVHHYPTSLPVALALGAASSAKSQPSFLRHRRFQLVDEVGFLPRETAFLIRLAPEVPV